MFVLHPERLDHLFSKLPIFRGSAFLVSFGHPDVLVPAFSNTLPSILLQQFVVAMHSSLDGAKDPNDMAVDRCLAGVNNRFDAAQYKMCR